MSKAQVISRVVIDVATGEVLERVAQPYAGLWALCEGEDGSGDEHEQGPSLEDLKRENEKLKRDNEKLSKRDAATGERLEKLEQLEKDREERARKKADAERLEKDGAKKLLDEKDKALKEAEGKVEAFERKQVEAAEKKLDDLPKEVREVVEEMREKLSKLDWVDFVERQHEITRKSGGADESFMNPGDSGSSGKKEHKAHPKSLEIIEDIGKGEEGIGWVQATKDPETGAARFAMIAQKFFKKMVKEPLQRLYVQKEQ